MNKTKLIFYVTLVIGVLLFVLEAISYSFFGNEYKRYLGSMLSIYSKVFFILKLLGINLIIGMFITMVYDTVYKALPGGFLRKGLNFAFLLWGLEILPFLLHMYISIHSAAQNRFFMLILMQYLIINLIVAFVITGLYDEFYLKAQKKDEEKTAGIKKPKKETEEVKPEEEKTEEPVNEETNSDSAGK